MNPVRVALDGTPLLGQVTGVGRYTQHLLESLLALPDAPDVVVTAVSARGHRALPGRVPAGVAVRTGPAPAGVLHRIWSRSEYLPAELLTGRVDLVHGTNFVLPPLRRARGVVTVHDLAFLRHRETVTATSLRYRELVPRSIARAAVVCTPSEAVRAQVVDEYGVPADRVIATPLGVDAAWFTARPPSDALRARLGLPERYAIAVGTLEPRKNLGVLIDAVRRWHAADPAAPALVLAGPPGWGERLADAGLPPGAVVLTGYLDGDELRAAVAGAAVLAFPSLSEGFGLPPAEALACGVPVVASDLPVTREVSGDQATYVPPTDADAWASALARAVASPRGEADERRRARAARWTWRRCAELTLDAYRRALRA